MATEIKYKAETEFFANPEEIQGQAEISAKQVQKYSADCMSQGIKTSLSIRAKLAELLQKKKLEEANNVEGECWEDGGYVQLDENTSSIVKDLISQSESIERVHKERIFEEEITEREMDIINQRVALQQKQFAEFERREFQVKSKKIRGIFENLNDEEITLSLKKSKNDEDEAIIQLSSPGFLMEIRKEIAYQYTPKAEEVTMTDMQRHEYEVLLKKRTKTIKKTTAEAVKRKQHTVGRLPLDKALEQLRQHTKEAGEGGGKDKGRHLEDAMKGWSVARIKAYKAIKTRPNAYYYRFNAPGEVQRVGQWTQEEQRLFHSRLAEIGANGQWGIFSMVIPGRVGYQCSNYYRYLIESKQLVDPNYVLDSKGKAHFLFTTKRKNADGTAVKEFRVHNRQNKAGAKRVKASGRRKYDLSDDTEEMTPESSSDSSSASVGASRYRGASNRGYKRRRMSDSDDEIRADDVSLSSDDDGLQRNSSDREYYQAPPRATGTTALGLRRSNRVGKSSKSKHGHQSYTNSDSGRSSTVEGSNYNGGASSDANNASSTFLANSNNDIYISDSEYESEDTNYNPLNPLPDFTDPITLEKVTKPAISPYGHVMDYDSWIRCLMFPPDGSQKNICPLTKKPLNKRELVILTHDNIEEYRDRIVNK